MPLDIWFKCGAHLRVPVSSSNLKCGAHYIVPVKSLVISLDSKCGAHLSLVNSSNLFGY